MALTKAVNTSHASLRPLDDPSLAPTADQLEGRRLLPLDFTPETSRPVESDGAPLSKFGYRFREVLASTNGITPDEVDLGLVRMVEALNADTDANLLGLASPSIKRTEQGIVRTVRLVVNTPLLLPWLLNGRALRRMAAGLRGAASMLTRARDHAVLRFPEMEVTGPEHVLELVRVQRELLNLHAYLGEQRDLVDSLVRNGVLDPPDVVPCHLVSQDRGSAWTVQTAEGAQRLFGSLLVLDLLATRDVNSVSRLHWRDGDRLRDLSPAELSKMQDRLLFEGTSAHTFFPSGDIRTWLKTVAAGRPAAVAFQLLRTMNVNFVVSIEPYARTKTEHLYPASATVQELIRSYHIPGKAKANWHDQDVQGLIAISAIDDLCDRRLIHSQTRKIWLGETRIPWEGKAERSLHQSRVHAATLLIAALTVKSALNRGKPRRSDDSLDMVNQAIKDNHGRVRRDDRPKVAAAQAVVVLGYNGRAEEGTVSAALFGMFKDPTWAHAEPLDGLGWPGLIEEPLPDLTENALRELEVLSADSESADLFGPNQLALGALGAVALIANPTLVKSGGALTRTGRGKKGGVSGVDPSRLIKLMLSSARGIYQLTDAIASIIAVRTPAIPVDREDGQALTDSNLRKLWFGESLDKSVDGDPYAQFALELEAMVRIQGEQLAKSEALRTATARDMISHDANDDETVLFETMGISEHLAEEALNALRQLTEFFFMGRAFGQAAARFPR